VSCKENAKSDLDELTWQLLIQGAALSDLLSNIIHSKSTCDDNPPRHHLGNEQTYSTLENEYDNKRAQDQKASRNYYDEVGRDYHSPDKYKCMAEDLVKDAPWH
jgi:hypothetical protein